MNHVLKVRRGLLALACSLAFSGAAGAIDALPVFDAKAFVLDSANTAVHAANAASNAASAISNAASNVELLLISKQLSQKENGKGGKTVNYYTEVTSNKTTNIEKTTTLNYEINTDFKWIIKTGEGGSEIIPIPRSIADGFEDIKGKKDTDKYIASFQSADKYELSEDHDLANSGIEGSRARKAANDMLVKSLDDQMAGMTSEADALAELAKISNKAQGHGNQLQVANALAGSQIDQTMKLRSMLLASEGARATEAHVRADKDARAIATGRRLRKSLTDVVHRSAAQEAAY